MCFSLILGVWVFRLLSTSPDDLRPSLFITADHKTNGRSRQATTAAINNPPRTVTLR
jgi:hypothetical protein